MSAARRSRTLRGLVATGAAAALALVGMASASTGASAAPAAATATYASGTLSTLPSPVRKLDTRWWSTPWAANTTHRVTRANGVPSTGVSAVVINLTAVSPSGAGWLTAYPGGTRPTVSSLNYAKGATRANMVTVPVASDGSFRIYTSARTHVIVDVVGYYNSTNSGNAIGATYRPSVPFRWYDTRVRGDAIRPGETVTFTINYTRNDVVRNDLHRAFALNITAVNPTARGYLTVWNGASTMPSTSTLNYFPGKATPNMAIVRSAVRPSTVADPGKLQFSVYNSTSATTHLLVDLSGSYLSDRSGLRYVPLTPRRALDTRKGSAFGPGVTRTVGLPGQTTNTYGMVGNLTAVKPTRSTFLTQWGLTYTRPNSSNVNAVPGEVVANAVMTDTTRGSGVRVYNYSGYTHVLLDVMGRFDWNSSLARSSGPEPLAVDVQDGGRL